MKQVLVRTLILGDKFVLPCFCLEKPYVYVVIDIHPKSGYADCVCINSGKIFTFGGDCPVVPVSVNLSVEFPGGAGSVE